MPVDAGEIQAVGACQDDAAYRWHSSRDIGPRCSAVISLLLVYGRDLGRACSSGFHGTGRFYLEASEVAER